jgi:hypothetical protein
MKTEDMTDQECQTACEDQLSAMKPFGPSGPMEMLPIYREPMENGGEACCGPPAGPASSIHEKPGYILCPFVEDFITTPAGPVPRVQATLSRRDHLGALRVRLGIGRNDYKIAPGLYAVGRPQADDPVLVSANYKLSFDHLRKQLTDVSSWILVLDTRGINVWCAAGKGTFGTEEIVRRVLLTRLSSVVSHRKLILPQLSAPGVSARNVKKECGFDVIWGPIRAVDIPRFIEAGQKASASMRQVTFCLSERLVLVPVEISLIGKPLLWSLLVIFILSGLGYSFFSFAAAWQRGMLAAIACLTGIFAGAAVVPILLPWIPGRAFALKGMLTSAILGTLLVWLSRTSPYISLTSAVALVLLTMAIGSYLAMNFTGTTPFTSPSGVEKEMRRFLPLQLLALLIAVGLWVGSAFI